MNLIVLHGALGSQKQMGIIADRLSALGNVHSFNFSGHGGQPFRENFSIQQFADELKVYITDHQIQNAHVFGYSMGGYVALYLSSIQPNILKSIFTYGTKFNWSPDAAKHETSKLNPEIIQKKVPDFAEQLTNRHHPQDWKLVLNKTGKLMTSLGHYPLLDSDILSGITTPTVIGWGTLDNMVTREESEAVAQQLQNGSLHMFENMAHPVERLDMDKLLPVLQDFYNDRLNS